MHARAITRLLWAVLLSSACGGPGTSPPPPNPAKFETFTLELEDFVEGQELAPTALVKLHAVYKGDLARSLRINVTITDPATREAATMNFLPGSPQDATSFDVHTGWQATHELFKKPGRYVVTFTASITATIRGSEPWTTAPVSVIVVASPALTGISLTPAPGATPFPYGSGMSVTVTGSGLWTDVALSAVDLDASRTLGGVGRTLAFDASQTSVTTALAVTDPSLETIGVHRVQLVATFGPLEVRSEPFSVEITHLVDSVSVLYRDLSDALHPAFNETRFDEVKELVIRVHGVSLSGHPVTIAGETVTATGDDLELTRVPKLSDFGDGKGVHDFVYWAESGGVSRRAQATLRRWKLESCGWFKADGTPAAGAVLLGEKVSMRAAGWGFPDTSGFLVFKKDQAEFLLWERDDGQNTTNLPQPLVNNDDEVDWFKVDVLDSIAVQPWTTVFTEEVELLGIRMDAEYYFEVTLQDETCTSGQLDVPSR